MTAYRRGGQSTPQTIIIRDYRSNAAGLVAFIFGLISIFFAAPIFVPLAVIMGLVAVLSRQYIWGSTGLLCAFIGFLTSPILMGLFGIVSLASIFSNHQNVVSHQATYTAPPRQAEHLLESTVPATPTPAELIQQAGRDAANAIRECMNRRLNGELKTYTESASCSNPKVIEAYQRAGYPYMDLIALFTAKRLEVAEKEDTKQITETQAKLETSEFFTKIVTIERQRNLQNKN